MDVFCSRSFGLSLRDVRRNGERGATPALPHRAALARREAFAQRHDRRCKFDGFRPDYEVAVRADSRLGRAGTRTDGCLVGSHGANGTTSMPVRCRDFAVKTPDKCAWET